jgi:hypothetical protein
MSKSTPVRCFMLRETDRAWRYLRRYQSSADPAACKGHGYHEARYLLGVVAGFTQDAEGIWQSPKDHPLMSNDDPRWPTKCDHCSYEFKDSDARQIFDEHIHVTDDGREMSIRTAPPGAMWFADWMGDAWKGPDGHALMVRCPDGRDWAIDSQASNCTMKNDRGPFDKAHRCWVRHGTPPLITVDKNGRTCGAGAGSIDTKHRYHGFLREGQFT